MVILNQNYFNSEHKLGWTRKNTLTKDKYVCQKENMYIELILK